MSELAEDIHGFWFRDCFDSPAVARSRLETWFRHDPEFDRAVRERFGDLPGRALEGEFDEWSAESRGAVSLVVVLDQLPRNCFRDAPEAFACDARALEVTERSMQAGFDRRLHVLEALVLYLPLQHAESRELQARSVSAFEALEERAPADWKPVIAGSGEFARRHRDVIDRWGRFPHRNAQLGRESSAEEIAWLEAGGDRF